MSDKFCEAYSRRYPDKITYMQLKKKGHAGACRNAGLDCKIESKYIWFVDSDDWLADDKVLKTMHDEIMSANEPDLLQCSLLRLNKDGKLTKVIGKPDIRSVISQGA